MEDTRLEAKAKDTHKKKSEAKDGPPEDRPSRGQGQKCSTPRTGNTGASVLPPPKKNRSAKIVFRQSQKKKGRQKIFKRSPKRKTKKGLRKFSARFLAFSNKILTVQKLVLSSSRGPGNFRGLEVSRPRTWPSKPRPRTLKCVLVDSTSDNYKEQYSMRETKRCKLRQTQ